MAIENGSLENAPGLYRFKVNSAECKLILKINLFKNLDSPLCLHAGLYVITINSCCGKKATHVL